MEPGPLVSGEVDLDNFGDSYTGNWRLGTTLNLNSPFHLGDLLTVRVMKSNERLNYGRISYNLPVGSSRLRLGAVYSYNDYRLGGQLSNLNAGGSGTIASVYATYPFIRSRMFNLNVCSQSG
jgi:hemolysin activation/secretion protein